MYEIVQEGYGLLQGVPLLSRVQPKYTVLMCSCQTKFMCMCELCFYMSCSWFAALMVNIFLSLYQLHEFDELRFDIRGHECTYFLRASSVEEKESWVEAIESNKVIQFTVYITSTVCECVCGGNGTSHARDVTTLAMSSNMVGKR